MFACYSDAKLLARVACLSKGLHDVAAEMRDDLLCSQWSANDVLATMGVSAAELGVSFRFPLPRRALLRLVRDHTGAPVGDIVGMDGKLVRSKHVDKKRNERRKEISRAAKDRDKTPPAYLVDSYVQGLARLSLEDVFCLL